jgi:hypothetical protein
MPGAEWTTKNEWDWLNKRFDTYLERQQASGRKKYGAFWEALFTDWFQEFPEVERVFPGRTADSLTEEEKETLGKAIQNRRTVRY